MKSGKAKGPNAGDAVNANLNCRAVHSKRGAVRKVSGIPEILLQIFRCNTIRIVGRWSEGDGEIAERDIEKILWYLLLGVTRNIDPDYLPRCDY